jgi:hypothetical protein
VTRYRRATTIHLVPAVREALEERAWAERKSVSKLAEILLGAALGLGDAVPPPSSPEPARIILRRRPPGPVS